MLAGAVASSAALLLTTLAVNRGAPLVALRLIPGRETGRALVVMVVGMLALGQALDSLTMLTGLGQRGSMVAIREALAQAVGPDLFLAVIVIGVLAGTAEEIFFRAYMQTRLGERFRPRLAVLIASACFGILHIEWLHAILAFLEIARLVLHRAHSPPLYYRLALQQLQPTPPLTPRRQPRCWIPTVSGFRAKSTVCRPPAQSGVLPEPSLLCVQHRPK